MNWCLVEVENLETTRFKETSWCKKTLQLFQRIQKIHTCYLATELKVEAIRNCLQHSRPAQRMRPPPLLLGPFIV